jgi:hypothetical protein
MFPCGNCIIDSMCKECCNDFIFFIDRLKSFMLDHEMVKNEIRYERMLVSIRRYSVVGGVERRERLQKKVKLLRKERMEH